MLPQRYATTLPLMRLYRYRSFWRGRMAIWIGITFCRLSVRILSPAMMPVS
ncbi:hypothetical protein [Gluconobacter wancherniae]|uniref:hypothetical protein n=1 Tax=Gluconobacter wancherniae TaxID=1307955 RepID=UPI001649AA25|nr:hypothetical protein [Gluconobacter wancherniae]MBF0854371.1 hypothetical protein [Gluconobacter wancherniae]MBS1062767.1 hypothetical protein [Gluconobacter wancherniae]MBS1088497.1 hypothetical protein [Gluconobacter wancherniae]MBS1094901.1 hypothetical protein [Gluconobacter wancherniae]